MFYYGMMLDKNRRKVGEHICCNICYKIEDMCDMFETTTRCLKTCDSILYFQFESEVELNECISNYDFKNGVLMRFNFN